MPKVKKSFKGEGDGSIFGGMSEFEKMYLAVRRKEGRLYSDEEVLQLPYVDAKHSHNKEWLLRQLSYKKVQKCLAQKQKALKILDVGCGNGWMTNRLSKFNDSIVTGIDINSFEIEQAKRVFANSKAMNFVCGNILEEKLFMDEKFDVIILSASIQYFEDIGKLLDYLNRLLSDEGEIHIIDSNFYTEENVEKSKQRSYEYYRVQGYEEMSKYYHHHLWSSLNLFKYSVPKKGNKFIRFFQGHRGNFPWIIITK
jgi:ubiquinone/menaquinone biosynthesis C-methylase UbiE